MSGVLDWVGGFADGRALQLEAYVTPVQVTPTQLADRKHTVRATVDSVAEQVAVPVRFSALGLLALDAQYDYEQTVRVSSGRVASVRSERPAKTKASRRFCFADETSTVLPFIELKPKFPEIAALIESRAPCPSGVTFLISWNRTTTIVVPCAELLASCYDPGAGRLAAFLTAPDRERFASADVMFNGFQYVHASLFRSERIYWTRIQRDIARAESEVRQLLPRAVAYYRRHKTFLPLLVRPPFIGNVTVAGNALFKTLGERTTILFTSNLSFGPAYNTIASSSLSSRLLFAPFISRYGVTLEGVGADVAWRGTVEDEVFEPRYFPMMLGTVSDGLSAGTLRIEAAGPPSLRDLISLHTWCLRVNR